MTKASRHFILLPSYFLPFGSTGSPWRVRLHVQQRKPRDQRRNYKTRCGTRNKSKIRDFASEHWTRRIVNRDILINTAPLGRCFQAASIEAVSTASSAGGNFEAVSTAQAAPTGRSPA